MELIKNTPMEVAWYVWQARPPQPSLTVVVKGTFTLVPDETCALADVQALPTGDEHHDDDVERSLRYGSDLEPLKPRGECLVVGSFHAPGGRAVTHSKVAFQIGPVQKQLGVFGDRAWHLGRASKPSAITSLELSWERAFGGPSFAANPVGRGIAPVTVDGQSRVLLPNFEDPAALVASRDDRPPPAGFGPIPRTWQARQRLLGTYDAAWKKRRYPWFPEDIDWRCFNAAPPDQQIDGYWRGDEEIALRHLHPTHDQMRCRLPGLRARAFLIASGSERMQDVGLSLDTITLHADEGVVYCVWRGLAEVAREDLSDIEHLYVVHEEPAERPRIEDLHARYRAVIDARAAELLTLEPEPPPPTSSVVRRADLMAAFASLAPGAKWAHLDQALTLGGDQAALKNALAEAVAERGTQLRPVFDDALGLDEPVSVERELSPEELLELELQLALGDLLDPVEDPVRAGVRAALAQGESLANRDLSGADLSSLDLSGADLSGAILVRANLSGARLERAKLDGASLGEAELSFASFDGCTLLDADLTSVRAHRVRMHGCDLTDVTMAVSFLREGRFSACTFVRADLSESDLGESDFRGCVLDECDLSASILESASFHECSLVDAWLQQGVKARRVSMDGCNATLLRAADGGDFEEASFKRTVLDGARFGGARMRKANFNLARLSRADFSDASLIEASLMSCDLESARFDRAVLAGAVLLKSNLMQARFEGADLCRADLRGANLYQAELLAAKLDGARLELADVHGTRIEAR